MSSGGLWVACRRRVYILFARLANVRPLLVPLHRASASSKNCKTEDCLFIIIIIIIIIIIAIIIIIIIVIIVIIIIVIIIINMFVIINITLIFINTRRDQKLLPDEPVSLSSGNSSQMVSLI